jgi:hypothetical protein
MTECNDTKEQRRHNTRLAQWGLKWFIETLCFYCKFVLVDNFIFQNPPLRQAWERWWTGYDEPQTDTFKLEYV